MDGRRSRWFDLPAGARDWLLPGEPRSIWLPADPTPDDVAKARECLAAWDGLVGRIVRACLFDDTQDPRRLRKDSEAVAAVAQDLATWLDP